MGSDPHPPSLRSGGLSRDAGEAESTHDRAADGTAGSSASETGRTELIVVGLNDRTAPIELRERVALAPERRDATISSLRRHTAECVVVSTCNRVELYAVTEPGDSNLGAIVDFLAEFHALDPAILRPHLYVRRGMSAARHLFAVASGLDSMIVGEAQILGQIRSDYEAAVAGEAVGTVLSRAFQSALRVGKQVRTVTRIGRSARSVGSAAVDLVRRVRGDLGETTVLVIGSGSIGEHAARAVAKRGVARLVVTNRTYSRAVELTARIGGQPAPFADLPDLIAAADVVLSCTAAPGFVINRRAIESAMVQRPERRLLLVDLALPRDVDPGVGDIAYVDRFDLDDLQSVGALNLEENRRDLAQARRLVEAEVGAFEHWLATREVVPTIAALRDQAEEIRQAEIRKALGRMGDLTERQRNAVEAMSVAIVNKLLHAPTMRLKASPELSEGRDGKLTVVRGLFGLDEPIERVRPRGAARRAPPWDQAD